MSASAVVMEFTFLVLGLLCAAWVWFSLRAPIHQVIDSLRVRENFVVAVVVVGCLALIAIELFWGLPNG